MSPKEKRRQTMIKKFGSEEAYLEHMKAIAIKGGSNGHKGGFAGNPELAREAGKKGGRAMVDKYYGGKK